jgi:hypothetical protein
MRKVVQPQHAMNTGTLLYGSLIAIIAYLLAAG